MLAFNLLISRNFLLMSNGILVNTSTNKAMLYQILNSILIVFAAFMSAKQGLSMINPEHNVMEMFAAYGLNKAQLNILGMITLLSGILILIPWTFLAGNFLMAAAILFVICLKLGQQDLKGFAIEIPFFLLNLVMIYLQYPINFKNK